VYIGSNDDVNDIASKYASKYDLSDKSKDVILDRICKQRTLILTNAENNKVYLDAQTRDQPYLKFPVNCLIDNEDVSVILYLGQNEEDDALVADKFIKKFSQSPNVKDDILRQMQSQRTRKQQLLSPSPRRSQQDFVEQENELFLSSLSKANPLFVMQIMRKKNKTDDPNNAAVNIFVGEEDDEVAIAERFVEKYALPVEFKVHASFDSRLEDDR
jgi:hypothetical protein